MTGKKKASTTQAPRKKAQGTDATKLLKEDHAKVKALFEKLEKTTDRAIAKRRELFDKIRTELVIHAKVEEEIFYPMVRELRSKDAKELYFEAHEEHAIVKMLLRQISEIEPDAETFKAKCKVLMDVVLHHAKEEEREMFREVKARVSTEELKELGMKIEERKEFLMSGGADLGESEGLELEMMEQPETIQKDEDTSAQMPAKTAGLEDEAAEEADEADEAEDEADEIEEELEDEEDDANEMDEEREISKEDEEEIFERAVT
jgi:hemerythrin superfamily protein